MTDIADRVTLVRSAALFVPLLWVMAIMAYERPNVRQKAGLFLAFLWNLPSLLAVNWLAQKVGWWQFDSKGGLLLGFPVDLMLGWAILWGPIAGLLSARIPMTVVVILAILADLLIMPACEPVVRLGRNWLLGEVFAVALCLVPAILCAHWTATNKHLAARAVLQMFIYAGLFIFMIPVMVIQLSGGSLPHWSKGDSIEIQLIMILALPGVSALQEFATRGNGTPFPYDPQRGW